MDCFPDQMDKVQSPAILNSIHATHDEAPSTQQQPSPLFAGTDSELLPGGNFGGDHT